MATSQNGWTVDPPRRARQVLGSKVKLIVRDGAAGDVLMYIASQFDKRVENIDNAQGHLDDWGYANRPIRGSNETSNHASATAIDLNATRHPLGASGTFSAKQKDTIHKILKEVDNVIRWGGDYSGRKDEMHFEINASPDKVKQVASKIGGKMITEDQMNILYRFRLGREPSKTDISKYKGKVTFDKLDSILRNSESYKRLINEAKNGNLNCRLFLPSSIRKAYKED